VHQKGARRNQEAGSEKSFKREKEKVGRRKEKWGKEEEKRGGV